MTLTTTYTQESVKSVKSLKTAHGIDQSIDAGSKNVESLVHQFDMLAIKLRKILGTKPMALVDREKVTEMMAGRPKAERKYILRILDRWQDIRALIKKLDPEYFLTIDLTIEEKMVSEIAKEIANEIDKEITPQITAAVSKNATSSL